MAEEADKQAQLEKELAEIAKKESKKKAGISDKEVKAIQAKLDSELTFSFDFE